MILAIIGLVLMGVILGKVSNKGCHCDFVDTDRFFREDRIKDLENSLIYWKYEAQRLRNTTPMCHTCFCPNFQLEHDYKTKYYAVDKDRQDLVDKLAKGEVIAKELLKEITLTH